MQSLRFPPAKGLHARQQSAAPLTSTAAPSIAAPSCRRRIIVAAKAEGSHTQGPPPLPELLGPPTRPEGSSFSAGVHGGSGNGSSLPALLEKLDGLSARLSTLQSHHQASHSKLQAMHAELQSAQLNLRQGIMSATAGVDSLSADMGRLSTSSRARAAGPRSPYASKIGKLLARELLAQRLGR